MIGRLPFGPPKPSCSAMSVAILRLLTIAALVLMPFGMSSGASAAPNVASSPDCADHLGRTAPSGPQDHQSPLCAMACIAMPANEAPVSARLLAKPLLQGAAVDGLVGVILEIATPPPRHG